MCGRHSLWNFIQIVPGTDSLQRIGSSGSWNSCKRVVKARWNSNNGIGPFWQHVAIIIPETCLLIGKLLCTLPFRTLVATMAPVTNRSPSCTCQIRQSIGLPGTEPWRQKRKESPTKDGCLFSSLFLCSVFLPLQQ